MNRKSSIFLVFLSSTVSTILAVCIMAGLFLAVTIRQAQAAASCFTDTAGYWAQPFICWMKATGISSGYADGTFRPDNYITRAEVAALLYKMESGDTYVNAGPSGWVPTTYTSTSYVHYRSGGYTELLGTGASANQYELSVPLIAALHGQRLTASGARLCYDASESSAYISGVFVGIYSSNSPGVPVIYANDLTTRTDFTCRTYSWGSGQLLDGSDSMTVTLTAYMPSSSTYIFVWGATAIQGFGALPAVLAPDLPLQTGPGTKSPLPGNTP